MVHSVKALVMSMKTPKENSLLSIAVEILSCRLMRDITVE